MGNIIIPHRYLETVQDWVQADTPFDGSIGIFFKLSEEFFFFILVKSIHDLVCKPYKSINILDRDTQVGMQQLNSTAERSTVLLRYSFAALLTNIMEKFNHFLL